MLQHQRLDEIVRHGDTSVMMRLIIRQQRRRKGTKGKRGYDEETTTFLDREEGVEQFVAIVAEPGAALSDVQQLGVFLC